MNSNADHSNFSIAVIGFSGRFPNTEQVEQFWNNLLQGKEASRALSDEELRAKGVDEMLLANKNYVKTAIEFQNKELFAAAFFEISPREAELMDPQLRLLLECAYQTIEHAGYAPRQSENNTGVFIGSDINRYFLDNILSRYSWQEIQRILPLIHANSALATQLSYHLNLHGPSLDLNTACSSSLTAVHLACTSLLTYQCDTALAGGVSINPSAELGYLYHQDGILSPDGHCRAFDENAEGTTIGQGISLVMLKRLEDAIQDNDTIYAVIRGSAINNDGARKVGYTAPSVNGQVEVINRALAMASLSPTDISYIECHGTGTKLGDPIELTALNEVYGYGSDEPCYFGSLKPNIGHLNTAAGIAGLLKVVLSLYHKKIPPSINLTNLNPAINLTGSRLQACTTLLCWNTNTNQKYAALSSFGIGGTNVHLIAEAFQPLTASISDSSLNPTLITLSAKTTIEIKSKINDLIAYLKETSDINIKDLAFTLNTGRTTFQQRAAVVGTDKNTLIEQLLVLSCDGQTRLSNDLAECSTEMLLAELKQTSHFDTRKNILNNLADLWSCGHLIDWQQFYQQESCRKRIAAPTYPFSRDYYWLDSARVITQLDQPSPLTTIAKTVEETLFSIWRETLGIQALQQTDNFYALGGNSLLAIDVITKINLTYDVTLTLQEFLINATIEGIIEQLLEKRLSQLQMNTQ